jgi:hypothetical protein
MAKAKTQKSYEFTIVANGTMYQCKRLVTGTRVLTQTVHVAGFGSANDSGVYGVGRNPAAAMQRIAELIAARIVEKALPNGRGG